jgi:hypothetical protein
MKEIFKGRYFRLVMIFVVVPVLSFFLFRGMLLDWILARIQNRVSEKYGASLVFTKAEFRGISGLSLEGTGLISPEGDTLFYIHDLYAKIRILPLFGGKIRVESISGQGCQLSLVSTPKKNNFSWLIPKDSKPEPKGGNISQRPDYPELLNKITSTLFESVPDHLIFRDLEANLQRDSSFMEIKIPVTLLEEGQFSAIVKGKDNLGAFEWNVNGEIKKQARQSQFTLYPILKKENRIPFTGSWMKLKAGLDTLKFQILESGLNGEDYRLSGNLHTHGVWVNHWRLAPAEIKMGTSSVDFICSVNSESVIIEQGTKTRLNQMDILTEAEYHYGAVKKYRLSASIPEISSEKFFYSLPLGLFTNLEGIRTEGTLSYKLDFALDSEHPESVIFESELNKKNFKIRSYGKEDLSKINREFLHDVFEKGQLVKQIQVGLSNPDFVPFGEIPPTLVNSVLSSEDGNFFTHQGFNIEAFRKSIAENYKKGKFARGGSTISMQLVKNVFLTRNKTIARKIEEALIVWLIETNRIASKERMLEVYLNIIEWGPGVYGIGPASAFYFKKKPQQLSLEECIYLAMIIPRPKGFSYHFDPEGNLKEYTQGYFNLLSSLLVSRGVIDSSQKTSLNPQIKITGPALKWVLKSDSTSLKDSILTEETEFSLSN